MNNLTALGTGKLEGWLQMGAKQKMDGIQAEIKRREDSPLDVDS